MREKEKAKKKGIVNIFYMLITIGICIAVIMVIFGVVIPQLGSQSETMTPLSEYDYELTTTLDSFTGSNTSAASLVYAPIQTDSETIFNATYASFINTDNSNYTMDYTAGTILSNTTGLMVNGLTYYANYTYGIANVWYGMRTNMSTNVLSWVGSVNLVVIISLLALVIMAVGGMMVYRGRQGGMGGM